MAGGSCCGCSVNVCAKRVVHSWGEKRGIEPRPSSTTSPGGRGGSRRSSGPQPCAWTLYWPWWRSWARASGVCKTLSTRLQKRGSKWATWRRAGPGGERGWMKRRCGARRGEGIGQFQKGGGGMVALSSLTNLASPGPHSGPPGFGTFYWRLPI